MSEELRARVLEIETELKAFAPLMQQRVNALTADAAKTYAPAFDRISALLALSMWLVEKKAFDPAPPAVKVLLARIIESFGATQVLLKCGFPASGAVAVRSLFEATANLHLVLANKRQVAVRAKLFENYIKV